MAERLAGRAGPDATARRSAAFGSAARPLGTTGLVIAPIGFAGHRVRDDDPLHHRALRDALLGGVDLIDTHGDDGRGERLVGKVLAQMIGAGELARDEVVVVAELGELPAQAHASPPPEAVIVDDARWHCIHPGHLAEALQRSLDRLGLAHIDVLLLRDPAPERGDGTDPRARASVRRDRLARAFAFLEQAVADGTIGAWGVSSDGLAVAPDDPAYTSLAELVALARDVAGDHHHLGVVQLPLNLLELGAARHRDPRTGQTTLETAGRHGVAVLARRPLAAFADGRPVRLAAAGDPPDVAAALARVRKLEAAWARDLGRAIRTSDGRDDAVDLFRWGQELARVWPELADLASWQSLRHDHLAPQLGRTSAALLGNLPGPEREAFAAWWQAYGTALHQAFTAIEAGLVAREQAPSARLVARLDPLLPAPWREQPLARKAVLAALGLPVTCVLVGMRRPTHVADMLALRDDPGQVSTHALDPDLVHAALARPW